MNNRNLYTRIIWLLLLALVLQPVFAQDGKQSLIDLFTQNNRTNYTERVFVHLDRNHYLAGERIWFTIFCLEQNSKKPSVVSSVAYIELLDHQGEPVLQKKIELSEGKGNGFFEIPVSCKSEEHIIRSYTSWQRNFGPENYNYNKILIIHPSRSFKLAKDTHEADSVSINFFPEGGNLVQGVPNHIVFTINGENNEAVEGTGGIFSEDTVLHTQVSTLMPGIGSFWLLPEKGRSYQLRFSDSVFALEEEIRIPEATPYACALKLNTLPSKHQIALRPGQEIISRNRFLTALVWNESDISLVESIHVDTLVLLELQDSNTAAGINYLTVFDEQNQVIAERMFYINGGNSINVEAPGLRNSYRSRDTVAFKLDVSTSSGIALSATASVSVSMKGTYEPLSHSNSFISKMYSGKTLPQLLPMDLHMIANSAGSCYWVNKAENNIAYMPEMDGLMVSGTIQQQSTKEAIAGMKMILSFIDSLPDFYCSDSDEQGRFFFSLDPMKERRDMIIQPLKREDGFLITLDNEFTDDPLPDLKFASMDHGNLPEIYEDMLLNKQLSEAFSIDNGISSGKKDKKLPFYGEHDHEIVMKDFIKLPVMEEVFRELGKRVFLTKNGNTYEVSILDLKTNRIIGKNPMFLLDGVPFFSSEKLLGLDPALLSSVKLKSERYFMNNLILDGIIDIRTMEGEARQIDFPRSAIRMYFHGFPEGQLSFETPLIQEDQRIPIFHSTLYFNPEVSCLPGRRTEISFIAPDREGIYDVIIKVLGEDGGLAEKQFTFMVE